MNISTFTFLLNTFLSYHDNAISFDNFFNKKKKNKKKRFKRIIFLNDLTSSHINYKTYMLKIKIFMRNG